MTGIVSPIRLTSEQGDRWLCTIEANGESGFVWNSSVSDFAGETEFLGSCVINTRSAYPRWFVNGLAPIDTKSKELIGVHEGFDLYFDLMAKARLVAKIVELGNHSKVWYAKSSDNIYVEEYET